MQKKYLLLLLLFCSSPRLFAQNRTVGLTAYSKNHQPGYHLLSPMVNGATKSYLLDDCGRVINTWTGSGMPGTACILGRDGSLIRTMSIQNRYMALGCGGMIEKYDWDGNLTWKFTLSDSNESLHHDITELPNGNILAIVWERHTADDAESRGRTFPGGRTDILSERIIEIQPIDDDSFEIVWEWRLWDHMVQNTSPSKSSFGQPSAHPELMDINFYDASDLGRDWWHLNGIAYNEELDQIMITSRSLGEFYVIDHSTNVVQAAGHSGGRWGKGGDFLFRWGNPAAYGRGSKSDQRLFVPHHAHWIPSGRPHGGKILIFNNGDGRPQGNYSTVDMIAPPMDVNKRYTITTGQAFAPASAVVKYQAANPTDFYAPIVSGTYMLRNGNLYTTYGTKGTAFEADSTGKVVWQYVNPLSSTGLKSQGSAPGINTVFRYEFYDPDFSGFDEKDMTPGSELELNPNPSRLCVLAEVAGFSPTGPKIYPNPAHNMLHIEGLNGQTRIYDLAGRIKMSSTATDISLQGIAAGVYVIETGSGTETHREKLIIH